jgi:peptidoglycan/LPS O-acetylase OafA/YrhL
MLQRRFSTRWAVFAAAFVATLAYSTLSWFVLEKRLVEQRSRLREISARHGRTELALSDG